MNYLSKMQQLRDAANGFQAIDQGERQEDELGEFDPFAYLTGMAHGLGLEQRHAIAAISMVGLKLRGWRIPETFFDNVGSLYPDAWVQERRAQLERINRERVAEGLRPLTPI